MQNFVDALRACLGLRGLYNNVDGDRMTDEQRFYKNYSGDGNFRVHPTTEV